jgi:hypothetical protein
MSGPNSREVAACRPWLEAELATLRASRARLPRRDRGERRCSDRRRAVTRDRGRIVASPFAERTMATIHPSAILRAPDEEARRTEYARFVDDLRSPPAPQDSSSRVTSDAPPRRPDDRRPRAGTFPPLRRASDKPIAIACFRLFTFRPDRPLLSVSALHLAHRAFHVLLRALSVPRHGDSFRARVGRDPARRSYARL